MTQEIPVTSSEKPTPRRPEDGFMAWQATLGYISQHHSPDALLKLALQPDADGALYWSAVVSWGVYQESIRGAASLGAALTQLWEEVDRYHNIFLTSAEAVRQPAGYTEFEWLDVHTQDILHRLIWTTQTAFKTDWQILIVYQPTEISEMRVQLRLLAQGSSVSVGGRGPSLKDAARDIFRNAVPAFMTNANLTPHDSDPQAP